MKGFDPLQMLTTIFSAEKWNEIKERLEYGKLSI